MNIRFRVKAIAIIGVILFPGLGTYARTHAGINNRYKEETAMTNHARGTFEVKLAPQDDQTGDASMGRMTIDKQFHGDIEGTSKGQMLFAGGDNKDSGAYVAVEKISGTLNGRKGTFILYHAGSRTKAEQEMNINVVPDSGTGELAGLSGKFTIIIADGKHSYDFEYTLPKAP